MSISKNLKYFREQQKLSQYALGKMLEIDPITIRRIEHGVSQPRISTLELLANHFSCSIDDFVKRDLESEGPSRSGIRKPIVNARAFQFFEDKIYHVYYLSETSAGSIKTGLLKLDKEHDAKQCLLHGSLQMHNNYDCTMVLDENQIWILGICADRALRCFITLHFPQFGDTQINNPDYRYRGGLGVVTFTDTHGNQMAQKICLSDLALDLNNKDLSDHLCAVLENQQEYGRISVTRTEDSDFCRSYILATQ